MQTITLCRYTRPDGGVTVSPQKPEGEYATLCRLVAEEGKALTDGTTVTPCIDTDDPGAWTEADSDVPEDPDAATEADYHQALEKMGVDLSDEG